MSPSISVKSELVVCVT